MHRQPNRLITTGLATDSISKGNITEEEYSYAVNLAL